MRRRVFLLALSAALSAQEVSQSGRRLRAARPLVAQAERAKNGMVASANELASQAGVDIMKQGGNAVDAAVAVGFVLAVVHPEAGNLGGGGYMLVRMADGSATAIDYKEQAPAAARTGMFRTEAEQNVGYKASAVPGTVAGFAMAHARFGKLTWKQVLEPARLLAKNGFPASQRMEMILALQVPVMKRFPETAKVFLHGSDIPLKQGELVLQPDLAAAIERIQKNGPREFYEGVTAQRIDADMRANNGTITLDDLRAYRAIERAPIASDYRGHPILAMGPSSSGGIAVLEMLNIMERFDLKIGEEGSSKARHIHVEAARRAFRDRAEFSADPAFYEVPVQRLIAKPHAAGLARTIQLDRATPMPAAEFDKESNDTTHFSVIDPQGNIVSNTYTLNGFYGSQVIAKGTGILLNDIMGGFGERGRNRIEPGKRPVSSMSPVIVLNKDNSPWLALGSPGSQTIPNTVVQVISNMIDFKMSLRDAIDYPRIHHQGKPNRIDAEPGALVVDVAERLKAMGHVINPVFRSQGDVHAVAVEPGTNMRLGWSDGRRGGHAIGY
ncbi:MAG TPA: gamma-glutamyltransferase [Bryobacteraceae bacterium]|nr:gamma-glutamyltransferase [Bryobacteraceae bacterium]